MKHLLSRRQIAAFLTALCMMLSIMPVQATDYSITSPHTGSTYTIPCDPSEVSFGIDVSYYQGTIDWAAVAADGVDFVFIRAAVRYSGTGTLATDSCFYENIEGALAAGLKVGVYVFSQAITEDEAREEAQYILDLVDGYDITLPLVFDPEFVEYSNGSGYYGRLYRAFSSLSTSDERVTYMTSLALAFFEEVEAAGYTAMYYSSYYWLRDYVEASAFNGDIWLARYNTATYYTGSYAFWQYSSSGTVNGISTAVDCNFCLNQDYLNCNTASGSTSEPAASSIEIEPTSYPTGTIQPASFPLAGTITSTYALTSITGSIVAADGTVVQTCTISPLTRSFEISGSAIDTTLAFASLADGTYTLTYTATDRKGYTNTWTSDAFVISATGSATADSISSVIEINPTSYPTGTIQPTSFVLSGTITSTYALTSVTGSIVAADGTVVQTYTVSPLTTTFELSGSAIDSNLKFASLSDGTYTLTYTATDRAGSTATWTSDAFIVSSSGSSSSSSSGSTTSGTTSATITINPTSYPTGNISAKAYALKGTITSTATLSTVTGEVLTADGTVVLTVTTSDINSTSFSLSGSTIDNRLTFSSLSAGYYVLKYTATDSSGTTATWTSNVFAVASKTLFTDVTNSSKWYYSTVYAMASKGIFSGFTDGTFRPNNNITRSEVILLLYKMAGSPEVSGSHPFTDATASWYQKALIWAYQEGIVAGTSATTFAPTDYITRESLALILYNFYNGTPLEANYLSGYTDQSSISSWSRTAVNWCVANGIISSTSTSKLVAAPKASTTRATAAVMLYNCMNKLTTATLSTTAADSVLLDTEDLTVEAEVEATDALTDEVIDVVIDVEVDPLTTDEASVQPSEATGDTDDEIAVASDSDTAEATLEASSEVDEVADTSEDTDPTSDTATE